jgi:hypothetical protein
MLTSSKGRTPPRQRSFDDPTIRVEWTKQQEQELVLPSTDKCRELFDEIREPLCGWSADAADLIEGIIYSGCVEKKRAR